ncbi:hypothetical protein G7009_01675 [Pseudomonas capeferrum]|uniref:hypothetical protein n=1 Tax=Pseudomonas capeferrum TaxID=1495066 RepID=UPI0015E49423|nr:hypothetical protein [Pseudomonas capeferrum]MBA1200511.1 hypothetical protein [Pseudomonas capeferrum]
MCDQKCTHADPGEVERIENERAEQWRLRRDAEADRDTKAAVVAELTAQMAEAERLHNRHVKSLEALNQQTEKQRDHWIAECRTLRAQLAERDVLLRETDELMYIMTGHDSHARLVHRYGEKWWDAIDKLRGKANGVLSASAEPSAPVEQDERADFERTFKKRYPNAVHTFELERGPKGQYLVQPAKTEWDGWQARAALARNP